MTIINYEVPIIVDVRVPVDYCVGNGSTTAIWVGAGIVSWRPIPSIPVDGAGNLEPLAYGAGSPWPVPAARTVAQSIITMLRK